MLTGIIIFLLAFLPTIVWFSVFNSENKEKVSSSIFTLIAWWLSTLPVLFYQRLWWFEWNFIFFKIKPINFQDNIAQIFGFSSFQAASQWIMTDNINIALLALFSAFICVGFLEEFFKHIVINPRFVLVLVGLASLWFAYYIYVANYMWAVLILIYISYLFFMPKVISFKSIDDAISISIQAAIGFSFVENMIYFWFKWSQLSNSLGADSIFNIWSSEFFHFLGFVFIRVTVVTMIHVLCSWVFGYHFGLAHFAKPELVEEIRQWRNHRIIAKIHSILKIPEDKVFMYEQLFKALFISISLHWIYDLIIQINATFMGFPLIIFAMMIYFFWGFLYLFKLLEDKNNIRKIGYLKVSEEYIIQDDLITEKDAI